MERFVSDCRRIIIGSIDPIQVDLDRMHSVYSRLEERKEVKGLYREARIALRRRQEDFYKTK